jgi:hypothetical protein
MLARYRKAVLAAAGTALTLATQVLPDPWAPLAGALLGLLTTYGVVRVANAPAPRPPGGLNLGPTRSTPLR